MAQFKKGDFVQITPKPDRRWGEWIVNVHDHFCSRTGYIDEIIEDFKHTQNSKSGERDPDEDLIKVAVFFMDSFFGKGDKWYYALFKKKHLIKKQRKKY